MQMKKNLLIIMNEISRGGIEIAAVNFQTHLDKDKYNCIYFIRSFENVNSNLLDEITASGAKIFKKPENINNYFKEYLYLKHFFQVHNIDIVHSHLLFYSGIAMRAASKVGVKKRIAHSHATKSNRRCNKIKTTLINLYERTMRQWLKKYATDIVACSKEAGVYLYGKDEFDRRGRVIFNGIEMNDYAFSDDKRTKIRDSLGLDNKFVVGHVGSIYWIKNQEFLIKVFSALLKINKNSVLLLVGGIYDNGSSQRCAEKLGIADNVMFMGIQDNIPDLMCAMDVFVFPSLFEALPIAPIEAQATGLPCVVSDSVTSEIGVNDNFRFMSLNDSTENWANVIASMQCNERRLVDLNNLIYKYSIQSKTEELEKVYDDII